MIRLTFSPLRDDRPLRLELRGGLPVIDGAPLDLTALPEGAELPASAIDHPRIAGPAPSLPSECFFPFSKVTRHRWEETGRCGVHPAAVMSCHISDQDSAALRRPIWLPVWFWSVLNSSPRSGLRRMQARLPADLKVGVGQKEQPLADVRCADFRR